MRNITLWPWLRFLRAWLLTFTLASLAHTQFNIWQLNQVDISVGFMQRVTITSQDWLGLFPTYGIIIAIGLFLGWSICSAILHFSQPRLLIKQLSYLLAGGVTIALIHTTMYPILQVTLIAGARDWGFVLQVLCGIIGACWFVYPTLTSTSTSTSTSSNNIT